MNWKTKKKETSDNVIYVKKLRIQVSRRKIKNLNIYIRPPHGEILVTAPIRMPENAIYAFIEKKYDWILQSQAKISKRHRGQEQVPISGEQRHYLMDCIRKYADKWEPVMGVHCTHWTIQQMKTRWGSCTVSKGTIRINLLLAVKPEECIEYIIVHELTHLLEPSHNQVFKSYMTKFLPDWKERDKLLKTLD